MFLHCIRGKLYFAILTRLLLCMVPGPTAAWGGAFATSPQGQTDVRQAAASFTFVRAFSSADDVRAEHTVLDRTLDIIAGPADPTTRVDALQSPSAVVTDSTHRVFVADPAAKAVHVFDFNHSKYARLDARGDRLQAPVALAVDGQDNLYVVDQSSRTVLVYDSAGKFRRHLGKLRGKESYFGSPTAIAVDRASGRIYVCDMQAQMIFVMDERGKIIRRLGKRGGGEGPGEFRFPTQLVVARSELFVLDSGNKRIQAFDTNGHFLRTTSLGYADRHTGLAADNEGNVYVSDPALNHIQVFRHEGQTVYAFDPGTIKGVNVSHPSGMWIEAGGFLYVIDSQTNRVVMFQIKAQKALR